MAGVWVLLSATHAPEESDKVRLTMLDFKRRRMVVVEMKDFGEVKEGRRSGWTLGRTGWKVDLKE